MRSRFLPILLALATLPLAQLLYPGCATMTSGTTQEVRVKSRPKGANVLLNGKPIGVTPVTAVVSRWGWHRLRIEMPGFEPYEVRLEKHLNPDTGLNLFVGGGWIVIDALTGAIFELDVPPAAERNLAREKAQFPPESGDPHFGEIFGPRPLFITTELKPTPSSRKIGQLTRR